MTRYFDMTKTARADGPTPDARRLLLPLPLLPAKQPTPTDNCAYRCNTSYSSQHGQRFQEEQEGESSGGCSGR